MFQLFNFSKPAAIAIHACAWLARQPQYTGRAAELCAALGYSQPHYVKVMQTLARRAIVVSQCGPAGGTTLLIEPAELTVWQVLEAVAGTIASSHTCPLEPAPCTQRCPLGQALRTAILSLTQELQTITIADVSQGLPAQPN